MKNLNSEQSSTIQWQPYFGNNGRLCSVYSRLVDGKCFLKITLKASWYQTNYFPKSSANFDVRDYKIVLGLLHIHRVKFVVFSSFRRTYYLSYI